MAAHRYDWTETGPRHLESPLIKLDGMDWKLIIAAPNSPPIEPAHSISDLDAQLE